MAVAQALYEKHELIFAFVAQNLLNCPYYQNNTPFSFAHYALAPCLCTQRSHRGRGGYHQTPGADSSWPRQRATLATSQMGPPEIADALSTNHLRSSHASIVPTRRP